MVTQKVQPFLHLAPEAGELGFGGYDVSLELLRTHHDVLSFAHSEVTQKRNYVCRDVKHQDATKTNVVVDESYDRAGDQKSTLHTGEQKRIGLDELPLGREFLNEGSN